MNSRQGFDCLDFEDNGFLNDDIEAISSSNLYAFINNRQSRLALKRQPPLAQFLRQTLLVCRFKQPWTKNPMNLQSSTNHVFCK